MAVSKRAIGANAHVADRIATGLQACRSSLGGVQRMEWQPFPALLKGVALALAISAVTAIRLVDLRRMASTAVFL